MEGRYKKILNNLQIMAVYASSDLHFTEYVVYLSCIKMKISLKEEYEIHGPDKENFRNL